MSEYKPIPVSEAQRIADQYEKPIVIILAFDRAHGLLHTTTFGQDAQDKDWAAQGGEIATRALGGGVDEKSNYQDYRLEEFAKVTTLRPVDEYHEDFGTVLWWHLPIQEPPYVGGGPGAGARNRYGDPTECQSAHDKGWLTHFSLLPDQDLLKATDGAEVHH